MGGAVAVHHRLEHLFALSGRAERERQFADSLKWPLFYEVVSRIADPLVQFGLSQTHIKALPPSEGEASFDLEDDQFWALLDRLGFHGVRDAGDMRALEALSASLDPASGGVLRRILHRSLRCGVGPQTIAKHAPELLAGAHPMAPMAFQPEEAMRWPVAVEPDFDGVRLVLVVEPAAGRVTARPSLNAPEFAAPALRDEALARAGAMFEALEADRLDALLREPATGSRDGSLDRAWAEVFAGFASDRPFALDGLMVTDQHVLAAAGRPSVSAAPVFWVFDMTPLDALHAGDRTPYHLRRRRLDAYFAPLGGVGRGAPERWTIGDDRLVKAVRYLAGDLDEVDEIFQTFLALGLYGAVVKPLVGAYHAGRASAWRSVDRSDEFLAPVADFSLTPDPNQTGPAAAVGPLSAGRLWVAEADRLFSVGYKPDQATADGFLSNRGALVGRAALIEHDGRRTDGAPRFARVVRFPAD